MKKVAILQSNYIPWRGYFDLLASVDEFVLYDDVQYTKRDWRNRNRIKTPRGAEWLTVPVGGHQDPERRIRDVVIGAGPWQEQHWRSLLHSYKRAPYFDAVAGWLEPVYRGEEWTSLSALNRALIERVAAYLGIRTQLRWSWEFELTDGRMQRLLGICRQAGATCYVSGPAARAYFDEALFEREGIEVEWFDYSGYADYPQLWGSFEPSVSVIDLLFNCGPESRAFMKYVPELGR